MLLLVKAGASVYSASRLARHEFPELIVVTLGHLHCPPPARNPLVIGEIDAKSIGVGQYQHDVNQKN